jgi:polysaccharide pyruvyl transferase WcaK-like protein
LGNYGNGNLGDEATLAAIIHGVRERWPDVSIVALSFNPEETGARHNVPAFPSRRIAGEGAVAGSKGKRESSAGRKVVGSGVTEVTKSWLKGLPGVFRLAKAVRDTLHGARTVAGELLCVARARRMLRRVDLLLIGGGGQLSDHFGGVWGFPFLLLKWCFLAKASRKKIAFISVGAGPLNSGLSRRFVIWALSLADYRSFRDRASLELVERMGFSPGCHVRPDLAYSLPLPDVTSVFSQGGTARVVGLNPFPYYDPRYWPVGRPAAYRAYLETLARFVEWLMRNDYTVMLLPTQLRADALVIEDLKATLAAYAPPPLVGRLVEPRLWTVDDLLFQISRTGLMVATRFHAILMSFLLGKPVLGLSNHRKMDELMRDMGQESYLLSLADLDLDVLIRTFKDLEANGYEISGEVWLRVQRHRKTLESEFDRLLRGASPWRRSPGEPVGYVAQRGGGRT